VPVWPRTADSSSAPSGRSNRATIPRGISKTPCIPHPYRDDHCRPGRKARGDDEPDPNRPQRRTPSSTGKVRADSLPSSLPTPVSVRLTSSRRTSEPPPPCSAVTHPQRIASVSVGTGGAAVPLQLREPLASWVLDPDLDKYRRMDPRTIINAGVETGHSVTHTNRRRPGRPSRTPSAGRTDRRHIGQGQLMAEMVQPASREVDLSPEQTSACRQHWLGRLGN
jgi:hypothetical protein